MHGGAYRGLDTDAVPTDGGVAHRLGFAIRVDQRTIHRPVEAAVVTRLDRARVARSGRSTTLGTASLGLERRNRGGELRLGAAQPLEVLLRASRGELRFSELGLALLLEAAKVVLLHPLVVPILFEGFL